ncbi:MAG: hypothetical protein ABIT20_16285 [Gemmatimonadaceae bacterium]
MKRIILGLVVITHALAHANVAIWASSAGPAWLVQLLWSVALLGYLSAGLGMLRVPVIRHWWKQAMVAGTLSSIALLLLTHRLIGGVGAVIDVVLLVLVLDWGQLRTEADITAADLLGVRNLRHVALHRIAWGFGASFLVYAAAVVAVRPLYVRWGTTADERRAHLPGDDIVRDAQYTVDHGITIRAPADSVWPWLVQLGQDRGGFYSYDWLERLAGDRIRNADRIHAEWQNIKPGDLVRATQPDYLGGRLGNALGWRVTEVVPGRAIVLENWGAFVVQPVDSSTSRLFVRTRGQGTPSFAGVVFGPLNVLVFEPVHFIMERGMMRGIRDRAEATTRRRPIRRARRSTAERQVPA